MLMIQLRTHTYSMRPPSNYAFYGSEDSEPFVFGVIMVSVIIEVCKIMSEGAKKCLPLQCFVPKICKGWLSETDGPQWTEIRFISSGIEGL